MNSSEYLRVKNNLISGKATYLSERFRVDMTLKTFHVGRTRVDYFTDCTDSGCKTTFKAFVGDGFRDPLDINRELPNGKPYNYIPVNFFITYDNPGYKPDNYNYLKLKK